MSNAASSRIAATEDISLRAGYDFTFGDHYQSHGIDASFQWEF